MTASAILKGKINKQGYQSIYIRISHEGVRTYKATKMKVQPEQFVNGKIVNHPKATAWNKEIELLIVNYQHQALEGFKKKNPKVDFYSFVEQEIRTLTRRDGTIRYYGSQLTKLKEFRPFVYLSDINVKFLNDYKRFMQARGNDENTIWSSFKFIRAFIRRAKKQKLIDDYIFDHYEFPKYENKHKDFLTEKELAKLDKFINSKCPAKIFEAGTWFLISCNVGLRIGDIKAFNKKSIVDGRLIIKTQKKGVSIGVPLSKQVMEYFKRIDFKPLSMHENTYNELLKIIAAAAGIDKHLSSHSGRHTTGMILANQGVSRETIAAILGHEDMRSTAIYSKVMNKRIDLELGRKSPQ